LLASLKHFLANEWKRATAGKRGGTRGTIVFDFQSAEDRFNLCPVDELTPERLYERRWAMTLLEQVLGRLRDEFAEAEKLNLFDRLKGFLTGQKCARSYRQVGDELAMSEWALGEIAIDPDTLGYRYRDLEGKLTASKSGLDKEAVLGWMKANGLDAKGLTQQWNELDIEEKFVRWFNEQRKARGITENFSGPVNSTFKVPRFELQAANLVEIAEQAAGRKIADLLNPAAFQARGDSWECKVTIDPWVVLAVWTAWAVLWLGGCVVWVRRMRRKP
jgi:hypothetical protein